MDLFLSYSSADADIVVDIARRLRDEGLETFLDRWSLPAVKSSSFVLPSPRVSDTPFSMRKIGLILAILIFGGTKVVFGEIPSAAPAPTSQPSALSLVDTYVKVAGAVVTGVATLLGIPIVFLTYRKTRAEIAKLELEANALREKQSDLPNQSTDEEGNIGIIVDRSENTSIHILADPRFLAPLLILLDFILAWIVLTLAGYLLSIFGFGALRNLALTVLAGCLLLPIARQVMRVRLVLRPPRIADEMRASSRQTRLIALTIYATGVLSSLVIGTLILNVSPDNLTELGRYLAWALIGLGIVMTVLAPFARVGFNRYLAKMQESDIK
jgi:hypothetical protein